MKRLIVTSLILTGCVSLGYATEISPQALTAIREQRAEALERQRRVIFNSDGCDASHLAKASTVEAFLNVRSYGLEGSQVDSIFYCPISAGFGLFTHRTRHGEILTTRDSFLKNNITADLIEQGTDPLEIIIQFARDRDIEVFFSMRMNDTHDVAFNPDEKVHYPLMPQLKKDHPEYLFGTRENRPPYGRWSAVDYGREEIRELAYRFFEEVCQDYDVDGLEMDFLRHAHLFKAVGWDGKATQQELDQMTELMARIRAMTEVEGIKRGKPFLIAIRVPDSVEYCRAMGIDLERWLADGLVDILVTSCYFRLNEWDYSVDLGHQYGVKVYPGLSESRVPGYVPPAPRGSPVKAEGPATTGSSVHSRSDRRRQSDESYRARAASGWEQGADGIYIYNEYTAKRNYLREIGDPEQLRRSNKLYFASVRGVGGAGSWVEDGEGYIEKSTLNPLSPVVLTTSTPYTFPIFLREDLSGEGPDVVAYFRVNGIESAKQLVATVNGHLLTDGEYRDGWINYAIDPQLLRNGRNEFSVTGENIEDRRSAGEGPIWDMEYEGNQVLRPPAQLPWRRAFNPGNWIEEVRDGRFYFADMGSNPQEMAHLAYPWRVAAHAQTILEAKVKVDESTDPLGVAIRFANGESVEYLTLQKDRIALLFSGEELLMDTTNDFHVYRFVMQGDRLQVFVDDQEVFDITGYGADAQDQSLWVELGEGLIGWNPNSLIFGSFSGPGKGGAYWEYIRYATETVSLQDFQLEVTY